MLFTLFTYLYVCDFFFFKQKTADEMRISDWSSDVCSSDLPVPVNRAVLIKRILDMEPHILPFAQPDQRGGEHAVHGHGVTGAAADGEMGVGDLEVDVLARQRGQGWRETGGTRPGPGRYKPCDTEPGQAEDRKSTRLNSRHSCAT